MVRSNIEEFVTFIREKGVVGLAIGIIIGGAVTKFVNAIVTDLVNPILGAITGKASNLETIVYQVPRTEIIFKFGDLLSNFINFIVICAIVYFIFMKVPFIRNIDSKKE